MKIRTRHVSSEELALVEDKTISQKKKTKKKNRGERENERRCVGRLQCPQENYAKDTPPHMLPYLSRTPPIHLSLNPPQFNTK